MVTQFQRILDFLACVQIRFCVFYLGRQGSVQALLYKLHHKLLHSFKFWCLLEDDVSLFHRVRTHRSQTTKEQRHRARANGKGRFIPRLKYTDYVTVSEAKQQAYPWVSMFAIRKITKVFQQSPGLGAHLRRPCPKYNSIIKHNKTTIFHH